MVRKISCVHNFNKPHSISVRISAELQGRIEHCQRQKKISRSDVVRDALRHYFSTK